MTTAHTLDPMTCPVADLRRLADRHSVAHYASGDRLVIRHYRGPRPDVHAALTARHVEVLEHIIVTRPDPRDENAEWDAAAFRVTGLPFSVLEILVINSLRRWLGAADQGRIAYESPLPWWAEDDQQPALREGAR